LTGNGNGELARDFLRDADVLGRKLPRCAAEAQPADELAARHHGHDHVLADTAREQGGGLGPLGQGGDVDHLHLPPSQALHVPHQRQRKADTRPHPDATPPGRGQPLRLAGREVEDVHDDPRDAEKIAHAPERRLGDLDRRLSGDERPVDLVQDGEPFRRLGEGGLRPRELRQVKSDHEGGAPAREGHRVREEFHSDLATIFQSVLPRARASRRLVRRVGEGSQPIHEPRDLFRRQDVVQCHAQELGA